MSRLPHTSDHDDRAGTSTPRTGSAHDPNRPPTVLLREPVDVLALVPRLLGFRPERSVVMLTLGSAVEPFHARVDLPTDPVGVELVAAQLSGVAVLHSVERAALVLYTPDAGLAEAVRAELGKRLGQGGVEVVCCLRADAGRWWALHDDGFIPDGPGSPFDLETHAITAEGVLEGQVVLESRQALAESLVGDDPAETERIAELTDALLARLAAEPLGRSAAAHLTGLEARWLRRRVGRFLDDRERLDTPDVARIVTLVSANVELRDLVWGEMTRADAGRHVDLWRDVVRRAPTAVRAAPAALLGFAAWLSGDGALAWCAVDRALEADPGYGLAMLVAQALDGAVPPSAWTPVARDRLPPYAG